MSDEVPCHFDWLSRWYAVQCNDDWEHSYGIAIDTLDNPGWSVRINLTGTPLEDASFDAVSYNLSAPDGDASARWHSCKVEDKCFQGFGGVADLATIIGLFREWAVAREPS